MSMQSKHTWEIWEGSFPPCPCSVTSRWYSQIFNHSDRAFSGGHFEACIGCTWQGPYHGRPSYRVWEDYSHAVARAFVACRYKLHDMPKFYLFSRLHHNCCDPDNNYWTAAGGRLPKTGHYSIVGCPGHVRYFSGLTWNFPLPQFIYVVNQSFPSPP